ncbi:MAG TPA: YcaO-like family protein [Candidatus Paceibacterota bacterium]|nr:YcaO-like family protein [Candidatus Paceibacterota bacterium]
MLKDIMPFDHVWPRLHGKSRSGQATAAFIRFLEGKLGASVTYDAARIGYESPDLIDLFELAERLRAANVVQQYARTRSLPDEPRLSRWQARLLIQGGRREMASGASADDDRHALTVTLAEALERYVWLGSLDAFPTLRVARLEDMTTDAFIDPRRFAGFSDAQLDEHPSLRIEPGSSFNLVSGHSWTRGRAVWIPAQAVSGHATLLPREQKHVEPTIRLAITTGLATHPQRAKALLSGALEIIERDAYIITWFNQLSPPRIDVDELTGKRESLARLVERCRRYRLEPHMLRFPTDAPAYALGVVLEDASGSLPRFTLGCKADRDAAHAAEGALLEAMRARSNTRELAVSLKDDWDSERKAADVGHLDRWLYWAEPGRAERLGFLVKGLVRPLAQEAWERDSDEEHFQRITDWCRERGYELASVSLTKAAANLPGWHIEMVVIPELQPINHFEKLPPVGGARLTDIPRRFGFEPRAPYLADPHPFA